MPTISGSVSRSWVMRAYSRNTALQERTGRVSSTASTLRRSVVSSEL
jgi:hypothetical protein